MAIVPAIRLLRGANLSHVVVRGLTDETPREVTRAGDAKQLLAGVCWSPDSRSLVLHIQNGSRRATEDRFEVYDLRGKLIRSVSAGDVPDATTRVITYLVDCR